MNLLATECGTDGGGQVFALLILNMINNAACAALAVGLKAKAEALEANGILRLSMGLKL